MRTHPGLRTQARTAVVATPVLQLALKFLQMPAAELEAEVRQELLSNPALELEDEADVTAVPSEGTDVPDSGALPALEEEVSGESVLSAGEFPDPGPLDWSGNSDEPALALRPGEVEPSDPYRTLARGRSLGEALVAQLRLSTGDPRLLLAGEYLIGSLDERGYLAAPLGEVAQALEMPLVIVERALSALQELDPPGVGARDLRECLLLQLASQGKERTLAWRLVAEQFENLAGRRLGELRRGLAVSLAELHQAMTELRRLYAHPARVAASPEVDYIYPELVVDKVGSTYEVYAQDRSTPRVRVSRYCREWLRGADAEPSARAFALSRLRAARWLIQALDRRRRTMVRVMQCIVEEQEGFFERGVAGLKPMTLRAVGNRCGLSESTVARITAAKYVQTPQGIFPLKYFFSSRLRTRSGPGASSRAVRERIRGMIAGEERDSPRSDEVMARMLEEEGIHIARRTVAKYRESLKIEPARLRRREADLQAAAETACPGARS